MATYQIYELSARAVMSYAAEQDGDYTMTTMSTGSSPTTPICPC